LRSSWRSLSCVEAVISIVSFLVIEALTGWGAMVAFQNYVTRARSIAKGA